MCCSFKSGFLQVASVQSNGCVHQEVKPPDIFDFLGCDISGHDPKSGSTWNIFSGKNRDQFWMLCIPKRQESKVYTHLVSRYRPLKKHILHINIIYNI
jgi:hypothetical protein